MRCCTLPTWQRPSDLCQTTRRVADARFPGTDWFRGETLHAQGDTATRRLRCRGLQRLTAVATLPHGVSLRPTVSAVCWFLISSFLPATSVRPLSPRHQVSVSPRPSLSHLLGAVHALLCASSMLVLCSSFRRPPCRTYVPTAVLKSLPARCCPFERDLGFVARGTWPLLCRRQSLC